MFTIYLDRVGFEATELKPLAGGVEGEHQLKDRRVAEASLRPELLDQHFKRKILVIVGL